MSLDPALLACFGLKDAEVVPIPTGLINKSFRVTTPDGRRLAIQAVSPIFAPAVHEDIAAVTEHLAKKGLETPRLIRTVSGERYTTFAGEIWRALTWIEGETIEKVRDPLDAGRAALLLARFHGALADLEHEFKARRLGVHDTPKHLRVLREALAAHGEHRLYSDLLPVAQEILDRAVNFPDFSCLPERVVHGDPKISNVIFDRDRGVARAMVDLDTVAPMALPLEMGDALRSWCNPAGEDAQTVEVSIPIFTEAIEGYFGAASFLTPAERDAIVPAAGMIMLELAARFAADALNERYFGWDPRRFASRGEHNLVRARGQLLLARDFAARLSDLQRISNRAMGRP